MSLLIPLASGNAFVAMFHNDLHLAFCQALPLAARMELVTALESLYTSMSKYFQQTDAVSLLQWIFMMLSSPHDDSDGPVPPGVLPPLPKVCSAANQQCNKFFHQWLLLQFCFTGCAESCREHCTTSDDAIPGPVLSTA